MKKKRTANVLLLLEKQIRDVMVSCESAAASSNQNSVFVDGELSLTSGNVITLNDRD